MNALADELDVNLHRTDIDTDPALRAAFNEHVPVLLHGDHEICRHALDLPVDFMVAVQQHGHVLIEGRAQCWVGILVGGNPGIGKSTLLLQVL
ncbi:MAG: glutaredoxin family protein, partial [Pseudomonadota bacterium]